MSWPPPVAAHMFEHLAPTDAVGTQLHQHLDAALGTSAADVFASQRFGTPGASNIPRPATSFIGRDGTVADAVTRLRRSDVRLMTFTGPGGTGKTRLALEVGTRLRDSFDGGTWLVPLVQITDPQSVPSAIERALELRDQQHASSLDTIAAHIGGRRVLLVLDNFEHVSSAAPWVTDLLARVPTLKALVTSRVVLRVPDEHDFPVLPLEIPDLHPGALSRELTTYHSVKLFAERARAADPSFTLDSSNAATIAEICVRLDGLPLAIELAAARIKLLSPRDLLERLERRLDVLSGETRETAHHQTLRRAIAWSYDLLGDAERRLFVRLAVFADGCTIEAAEAVCDIDGSLGVDVLQGIAALHDASLIKLEERQGVARIRMLETVREFALEQLERDPRGGDIRDWHRKWFLDLARRAAPDLAGPQQQTLLAALASEHANFRAALEHSSEVGDVEAMLAFGAFLWRYWLVRGHLREGYGWLDRAVSLLALGSRLSAVDVPRAESREPRAALLADALTGAGTLAQNAGHIERAAEHYSAALELRRRLGDTAGLARVLADLGWLAWRTSEYAEARRLSLESLELSRALGDKHLIVLGLSNLGWTAMYQGDFPTARELFEQGLRLRRELKNQRGIAFMLMSLEYVACRAGEYERTIALAEEALPMFKAVGDRRLFATTLANLAEAALALGDVQRAHSVLESEVVPVIRQFGDRWALGWALDRFSRVLCAEGDLAGAEAVANESLEHRRAVHDRYGIAESLVALALIARRRGDDARVRELLGESLALRREIDARAGIAECERLMARSEVAGSG